MPIVCPILLLQPLLLIIITKGKNTGGGYDGVINTSWCWREKYIYVLSADNVIIIMYANVQDNNLQSINELCSE